MTKDVPPVLTARGSKGHRGSQMGRLSPLVLRQKSAFQVLNAVTHITPFYLGSQERDEAAL